MFESGALFEITGTVAAQSTWAEDIYFTQSGLPMSIADLAFQMTFRRCDDNEKPETAFGYAYYYPSPDVTLSTTSGTLSVVADNDGNMRVLRITAPAGTFSQYGDYITDLASKDGSNVITPWGHGRVTVRNNPVSWS